MLKRELLGLTTKQAAQRLLGSIIERKLDNGQILKGKIVETEAYHQDDPASHTFNGKTKRNQTMFGPAGQAYVYKLYGIHFCLNVVTGKHEVGEAVLIRAIEPLSGTKQMRINRQIDDLKNLANGPGKLTQALKIDTGLNNHDLSLWPLKLTVLPAVDKKQIIATSRIGISKNTDQKLRFYIKNNQFISIK